MTGGAAVRLAWRQARGGGRHLAVVGACIALGVGALVAVGTLGAGLEATLAREAKSLRGGDVELRAARPLPSEAEAALERLPAGARQVRVRELVGMVRGAERDGSLQPGLKPRGELLEVGGDGLNTGELAALGRQCGDGLAEEERGRRQRGHESAADSEALAEV